MNLNGAQILYLLRGYETACLAVKVVWDCGLRSPNVAWGCSQHKGAHEILYHTQEALQPRSLAAMNPTCPVAFGFPQVWRSCGIPRVGIGS